jgi:hypothetical protein
MAIIKVNDLRLTKKGRKKTSFKDILTQLSKKINVIDSMRLKTHKI